MLPLCKSLKDLSDVQISSKLNKFKLKIAFCAILSYIKANRLNQISEVLTCDASISIAHKRSLCPSGNHLAEACNILNFLITFTSIII